MKTVHPTAKPPIADLIHRRRSAEELVDQVKRPIFDVHMALQEGLRRAIAPDQGHKRAAGPWPGLNLVPPALYHVWCHAKTPEDQHPRWSPGGPGAGARAGQRT